MSGDMYRFALHESLLTVSQRFLSACDKPSLVQATLSAVFLPVMEFASRNHQSD